MKRVVFLIAAVMIAAVLSSVSTASAMNIRFNIMYAPKHPLVVEAFAPWAEEVAKVTNGRVTVTLFPSSALAPPPQVYDSVVSRAADMGVSAPSYARDRFLLTGVMDLPMVGGRKAEDSSAVLWELVERFPAIQDEYQDVKLLWTYTNPAYQLHFTNRRVETLEDLRGSVISAGGTVSTQIVRALGASPEAIPMVDVYLALQTGVVEGCFLPYAPLRSQRMADVLKYHTEADLVANTFYVVMNKRVWDRISAEDRKAIDAISGAVMARNCGSIFDKHQEIDRAWMKEKGDEFIELSAEERARWTERILPIRDIWLKDTAAKGLPGQEILDTALKLMEERTAK